MHISRRGSSKTWHLRFRHKGREFRQSLGTTKLAEAKLRAAEIHRRVLAGERESDEPTVAPACLDLLAEYRDHLERRGRTPRHIRETCATIARVLADSGAETMAELDSPSLERAIGYLADRSARTQNMAIGAVRAWCRWIVRVGRWSSDPAAAVDKARALPARAPRRSLTLDELERLTSAPEIHPDRRLLYAVAAATGLRRGELAAVRVRDVDFSADPITIRLAEADTKNRKGAVQPLILSRELLDPWKDHLSSLQPDGITAEELAAKGITAEDFVAETFALARPPRMKTWRADLERAGITETTAEGRLDFHSLRVTFGTHLAAAGVPLSLAQRLMRHSTPALTSNYYTRWAPQSHEEAIQALANLRGSGHKNGHKARASNKETRFQAG